MYFIIIWPQNNTFKQSSKMLTTTKLLETYVNFYYLPVIVYLCNKIKVNNRCTYRSCISIEPLNKILNLNWTSLATLLIINKSHMYTQVGTKY